MGEIGLALFRDGSFTGRGGDHSNRATSAHHTMYRVCHMCRFSFFFWSDMSGCPWHVARNARTATLFLADCAREWLRETREIMPMDMLQEINYGYCGARLPQSRLDQFSVFDFPNRGPYNNSGGKTIGAFNSWVYVEA